ncbi:MAG: polysaccharide deacetylase family protein [Cyclobacteriaceae bacterium]|nr:polysaccharide deacetylase family protein [Cyclobacteriaceae bacterium]MDH5250857.1 polysaccharide deacetylase family protein [Cyclobacteriaceae bacterium]
MQRRIFIKNTVFGCLAAGFSSYMSKGKTHILTLSFDDGFKKSFYKIAEIFNEYDLKACLNVIAMGHEPGFVNDKFIPQDLLGDFDDWNKLKEMGHELMPHAWDHKNLTEIPLEEAKLKIDQCLDYFEKNLEGYKPSEAVYNFAYNASTPELDAYALQRVRAVRTGGWLVLNDTMVNLLPISRKPLTLGCWGHGPDFCDTYTEETINTFLAGSGGWLILNLHGLDDEGWGPVSTKYLDGLLKRLVKINHVDVLPAGIVLQQKAE